MNVLVTGATGFIGSHVARQLVREGHKVVAYDFSPILPRVADIADQIQIVSGDIYDLEILLATFNKYKIDHVVHLAAYLPEVAIRENPTKAIRINLEGTNNIFEASRLMNVKRVIYASSDSVNPLGPEEDAPVKPGTIYGHMKYFTEIMGRHFYQQFGLDTIGLRFCHNFGPGGRLIAGEVERGYGSGAIYKVLEPALRGEKVVAPFARSTKMNWIYVKDNARLMSLALQARSPKRRVHNYPGTIYTIGEVADTIKRVVPSSGIRFEGQELPILMITGQLMIKVDPAIAREDFGYEPKYTLEDAIREYVDDVKKRPYLYQVKA